MEIKVIRIGVEGMAEKTMQVPDNWMDDTPASPPQDPLEQLQAEYDALILDLSFRTTLLELGVI